MVTGVGDGPFRIAGEHRVDGTGEGDLVDDRACGGGPGRRPGGSGADRDANDHRQHAESSHAIRSVRPGHIHR